MRIKRSIGTIFVRAVFPALCVAAIAYFGYYAYWGERGYLALQNTRKDLTQKQTALSGMTEENKRLAHRIDLLKKEDPDIIEEEARNKLMDGAPGQVAVPRNSEDKDAPAPSGGIPQKN